MCKVHSIENGKVNACSLRAINSTRVMSIFSAQTGERMPLKIVLQLGEPVTASQRQDVLTVSQINFLNHYLCCFTGVNYKVHVHSTPVLLNSVYRFYGYHLLALI